MDTPNDLLQQRSLMTVALLAAFADGQQGTAEREALKRIQDTMGAEADALNLPALLQNVLLKRSGIDEAVAGLQSLGSRQLAYELAVCVCDADGAQSPAEQQFLAALKRSLGPEIDTGFQAQIDALAAATDAPAGSSTSAATSAAAASTAGTAQPDAATLQTLQSQIRKQAIVCGALELLPQSWASVAIIPLQVRLVHAIGTAHGAQLDAQMVKEFIATAGVGLTGQYLEQFGRKLLGGLLGQVLGGVGRGLGGTGAGIAMSFATTYALGQLALRYYGGGRQMSSGLLRQTYEKLLADARGLQADALPQIRAQAQGLDAGRVLEMVRGPLK